MKKISGFLVDKRKTVLIVFLVLTVICGVLMTQVGVNSDMTKYLPESSPMKQGLDIVEKEFPVASSFNLMVAGLKEDEKEQAAGDLEKLEYVDSVSFEPGDPAYNVGDNTLYVLNLSVAASSAEVRQVTGEIEEMYKAYDIVMSGDALGNTATEILPMLAGIAFVILLIILFIMCSSWVEPFLFLLTIGIAIIINMGTNILFGTVSDITTSIAAILQLVLSMDYSIMLLNRYRQEKEIGLEKTEAMKSALGNAFVSISSSSITTIVGMLALVFMSFTIGRDLGFVLAKGVLLSLICIFTVLPALILLCDGAIERTAKKSLHIKMDKIGAFSYKARRIIPIFFVILFAVSFYLKGNVGISYTMADYYIIDQTFALNNPLMVIYENGDEENIAALAETWEDSEQVTSVNGYSTTLGKELTCGELAEAADMEEAMVAQMFFYYLGEKGGLSEQTMSPNELIVFLKTEVADNEQFSALMTDDMRGQLEAIGTPGEPIRLSAEEFAVYSGTDIAMVQQIFGYYFMSYGQTEDGKIPQEALISFLQTDIAANPQFAAMLTAEDFAALQAMGDESAAMDEQMSAEELAEMFQMEPEMVQQLLYLRLVSDGARPQEKITLYDFIGFITANVAGSPQFEPFFTEEALAQLDDAEALIDDGLKQLVGESHSRLIINTSYPEESEDTFAFIAALQAELESTLDGSFYIVGNSAMAHEMNGSFPTEMNYITWLTALAIFIVVAIAFRSLSVPLILVCVIQCAIFITMGSIYMQGNNIYYLPLLIVQCLLMGATVDYGILYTSYYREFRQKLTKKEAVIASLNHSIHTILTSASILIAVTGVLGFILRASNPAISEILLIIARGGLASTVLVVFILPGILAAFDRWVCKKTHRYPEMPDK